jgi:hypothetical protein
MTRRASPALVWALVALACASEPSAPPDAGTRTIPTERFAGVLSGPGNETGLIDLTIPRAAGAATTTFLAGAAVSGTLLLDTVAGQIQLSGEVDASGAEVRFGGTVSSPLGRFSCSGAIVEGSLRGKCTGADRLSRDFDTRGAAGGAVRRFCGTWNDPVGAPAGPFNVLTQDGYAAAVFNSRIISGVAAGTLTGDELALTIVPIGTVAGRLSGDGLSGTWTVPAIGGGTFAGSAERCPTGAGPNPTDAGDAGAGAPDATMGSPDAAMGTPDAAGRDATAEPDAGGPPSPACPPRAQTVVPLEAIPTSVIAAADGYVFYLDDIFIMRAARDGRSIERFVQVREPVLDMVAGEGHLCYAEGSLDPTRNSFIQCKPITGTSTAAFVVTGARAPIDLAMADGHVYWVSRGGAALWRAERRPGAAATQIAGAVDLPSATDLYGLAATRSFVYFGQALPGTPNDVAVYSFPVGRLLGDATRPVVHSSAGPPVQFMSADGPRVFWLRYLQQRPLDTFGRIEGLDEGAGTVGTVAVDPQNPGALVAAGGQLYFSYGSGLAKLGPSDTVPTPLHGGSFSWTSDRPDLPLAVDETCMFWVGLARGQLGIMAGPR